MTATPSSKRRTSTLRFILIALSIVALVPFATIAWLLSPLGERTLHDSVVAWSSDRLGRRVAIDGTLKVHVGRHLQVSATGLRIANPSWLEEPDMLSAGNVLIDIDAGSLIARSPTLIVNEFRVDALNLGLVRTADDTANWHFEGTSAESDRPWLAALPFIIERIELPDAHIRYSGPRLDRPLEIEFVEFGQQRTSGDMLEVTATGQVNDTDMKLSGQIGPFANLLAAKNFSASIDGQLGELSLTIRARIDSLERPVDSEADIELRGPDAAYVASTLGVRNLGSGPFNLAVSVSQAPDGQGVRGSVVGRIGEFDISGDGELSEPSEMGHLTLRSEVSGPDVSLLGALLDVDWLPPERFHLATTLRRTGTLLQIDEAALELPDSSLSARGSIKRVDKLAGSDMTFHISGGSVEKFRRLFRIPGVASGPFDLSATLHPLDSGEDHLDLSATTALMTLTANGPLGQYPQYYGSRMQVGIRGADFGPFARELGLAAVSTPFVGNGQLEWTPGGASLKTVSLALGTDTVNLDGVIGTSPTAATDVQFGVTGTSLASLARYVGWSGFPASTYKAAGRVLRQNGRTRIDGLDLTVANSRLQLGGTIGNPPLWQGTALTFTIAGSDTAPLQNFVRGFTLPLGAYRAQGQVNYSTERIGLQTVAVSAAGADATINADFALPLGRVVSGRPNTFDVRANGPDLVRFVPDTPDVRAARQKFDVQAHGSWGTDKWTFEPLIVETQNGYLRLHGTLDQPPDFSATALDVQLRTPDLAQSARMFDWDLPSEPFDLAASITGTPTTFRMDKMSGHFGKSDFAGSAALDLKGAIPEVDLDLKSGFLDLAPLTEFVAPPRAVAAQAAARSSGPERLIPDFALPTDLLKRANARAAIVAAKTSFFGQTYDNLNLNGSIQNGRLTIDPLAFGGADGTLNAKLAVTPTNGSSDVRLLMNGNQIRLGVIPGMNQTAAASRYTVAIDVAANGSSLRDLAATVSGQARFIGAGGRVTNSAMNALQSDFLTELFRTLNPLAKRADYTDVVCQAYLFQADRGTLKTDPAIVVRTTDMDIVSNGSVDLRNESIDFNFKTSARNGIGISAGELLNAYVKVSGTLSKPYLTVDPTGTLVYGGAAFATGGLSILATTLWDRVSRQKDPCAAAVAESERRATTKQSFW